VSDFAATLKAAKAIGASKANDAQLMALYCDGPLQTIAGAVAPSLVWEGAQKSGLTTAELSKLSLENPMAVSDLMWI
jgi:hypothetical protein